MLVKDLEKDGQLPATSGLAKLVFERIDFPKTEWKGMKANEPYREGDTLVITYNDSTRFISLLGGRQFVVITAYDYWNSRAYFGGTDERPFLTGIELGKAQDTAGKGDEDGFFAALKPSAITAREKIVGADSTKRQGDIFAIRAPFEWSELAPISAFLGLRPSKEVVGESLFRTRHILTGIAHGNFWSDRYHAPRVLFEGSIQAPDHATLILEGVHFLAQADCILIPQESDC